jgi:carbon monoxide dehydrogenase subunit G
MAHVRDTVFVEAPLRDVWAFVSDIERCPEWIHFVKVTTPVTEGPIREGTMYEEQARMGPFKSKSEWQITEFEPLSHQTHVGRMPEGDVTLRIRLEPEGDGTRWHHEMDIRVLPKVRPLGWLLERLVVRRKMQADFRRMLKTAKDILEGHGASQESMEATRPREA